MTQEDLAERLDVSPTTLQAWERGRKPLVNAPFSRLQNLRRELRAAGADPGLLALWDKALPVDVMLAALGTPEPGKHPLGLVVPDRVTTELLAWPLSGQPPRQLSGTDTVLTVGRGELGAVTASLREVAERAAGNGEQASMIRRQVKFLIAKSPNDPAARQWAAEAAINDLRSPGNLGEWTPDWPVARSAAFAASEAGNLDPIHRFIDRGLSSDRLMTANLNYWAYWVGEYPSPWSGDSAMTETADQEWTGTRLLGTLLDGIVNAPYRDMSAHTLWSLLLCQRQLAASPRWQAQIRAAVSQALDRQHLAGSARQRLEQVEYLVRSLGMPEQQDENAAIVSFGYEAGQLKKLPRAGWLLTGITSPESVAEHSFRVAILAYVIAVQEGANPDHAAALGLFHDFPEARTGDVPSVGKPYVHLTDPNQVIADQAAALPPALAAHITALVSEHESAKAPDATLEARCSRDADKLECLMQAREYQAQGNQLVQPWIDSMIPAIVTRTGMALAKAAQDLSPNIWWNQFAASYGTRKP